MAFYELEKRRNNQPSPVEYLLLKPKATRRVNNLHYHEYAELLFGISGLARVTIGSEGYDLAPNTMVFVHPGEPHDVVPAGENCSYHVVKFLPNVLLAEGQSYSEYAYSFLLIDPIRKKQICFDLSAPADAEVSRIFDRIKREWVHRDFGYELSLRADVTKLCLYVMRRWQESDPDLTEEFILSGRGELMQNAVAYIQEHYADLTEEETARACGVSPSYLSRCFKKEMKTSFSAYVTRVRLKESERLLLTTNESVTDIAQTVGFSTSAYFIAKFRECHGITPHRYRMVGRADSEMLR